MGFGSGATFREPPGPSGPGSTRGTTRRRRAIDHFEHDRSHPEASTSGRRILPENGMKVGFSRLRNDIADSRSNGLGRGRGSGRGGGRTAPRPESPAWTADARPGVRRGPSDPSSDRFRHPSDAAGIRLSAGSADDSGGVEHHRGRPARPSNRGSGRQGGSGDRMEPIGTDEPGHAAEVIDGFRVDRRSLVEGGRRSGRPAGTTNADPLRPFRSPDSTVGGGPILQRHDPGSR